MQKLLSLIIILLAGSFALPAQQSYTYVVDEDFVHYENIYKAVEGLYWTESDQIIVSAQFHIFSGHFGMIRLFNNGSYDDTFGYTNSNGGGGGKSIQFLKAICGFILILGNSPWMECPFLILIFIMLTISL